MSRSKLVLVEGIPGSGKTSSAQFIAAWLEQNSTPMQLHLEGDLDHPADFESVAWMDAAGWKTLLAHHPRQSQSLRRAAWRTGADIFVSYRKLPDPPANLLAELARRDVYELPLAEWQRLTQARWELFGRTALETGRMFVFECCFLQNLLTAPLARFDQPEDELVAHVLSVARLVKPLRPALVYLDRPDVRGTLEYVAQQRPKEWLDFVVAYTTGQGWGAARGLGGFEGMLRFYETLHRLQLDLIPELQQMGFRVLYLPHAGQDWKADHARMRSFMLDVGSDG